MDRLTDVSFVKGLFENGLFDFNNIFSWDVLIIMIRPSHGYRLVNKMSFSRDVSITMIRPSHGYRLVYEMSLSKRCFDNLDTPLTRV